MPSINRLVIVVILNYLIQVEFLFVAVNSFLTVDSNPPIIALSSSRRRSDEGNQFLPSSTVMFLSSSSTSEEKKYVKQDDDNDDDQKKIMNKEKKKKKNLKKRSMYSYSEARKIARGHGFDSMIEFLDYDCAGAYQLPKNPNEVWIEEWTNWDDFLGITFSNFEEARDVARTRLGDVSSEKEYHNLLKEKVLDDDDTANRLPYKPDLKYKNQGWVSWEDFLSS
jgi:hypothetical protein